MYAMLTLQMGLDPGYVLDRMKMYEAKALLDHAHFAVRDGWEQARLIAYVTAQSQSTKKLEPDDIMSLPWEKKKGETPDKPTDEQIAALKAEADEYAKKMFSKAEKRKKKR